MKTISLFLMILLINGTLPASGQTNGGQWPRWSIDASYVNPLPATRPELGQPHWRATFSGEDTPQTSGTANFIDNGDTFGVGELLFSGELGEQAGLPDALWAIEPGPPSALSIYSNGERIVHSGSLESGHYELRYSRKGKAMKMILERYEL